MTEQREIELQARFAAGMMVVNAYHHDCGVLLFGFGPDVLLISIQRDCRLESHP